VSDDVRTGNVGDVIARDVTIRQGGARSVAADNVVIRQGGAARARAEQLSVIQGGVALARADKLEVTAGGVGAVLANDVGLAQTAAQIVAARESVELDQSAAGLVVGGEMRARDSAIGLLITPRFEGHGNRVLFGPSAALAFGAGLGLAMLLGRALLGRRAG
jgi:hypothetical protein